MILDGMLIFILAVAACAAVWSMYSALTCDLGWRAWICYQLARLQTSIFCRWRANNACPFPEFGAAIIVANHTSPVDPVIVWRRHFAGFRHPRLRLIEFMMAREYYHRPGAVGWVCRAMQCIPVARAGRDMGPVKDALQRLEEGHMVGLFPEGRLNVRTPDTRLLPGGTGMAWLALKSQAPVIPVFIHSAPRSASMVWAFFRFTKTRVTYGRPVDLSRWQTAKLTRTVLADVTDLIMSAIAELGQLQYTPVSADQKLPDDCPSAGCRIPIDADVDAGEQG